MQKKRERRGAAFAFCLVISALLAVVIPVSLLTASSVAPALNTTVSNTSTTTTAPAAFSIICPPDQNEELESKFVATNYTVVGTGCGNSAITVNGGLISFMVGKRQTEEKQNRRVARNPPPWSGNTTVVVGNVTSNVRPTTYTLAQIQAMFGTNLTKRDAFTTGAPFGEDLNRGFQLNPFVSFLDTDEYYATGDGDNDFFLQADNLGINFGRYASTADLSVGVGFIDFTTLFPPLCFSTGTPNNAFYVRFNHELNIFTVASISNANWVCVAKSLTNDPTGSWIVGSYDLTGLSLPWNGQGFSLSIWGDWFYVSYQDTLGQPNAWIGGAPALVGPGSIYPVPLSTFYPTVPFHAPLHVLHQGISTRGSLFTAAPCGVLCFLNQPSAEIACIQCTDWQPLTLTYTATTFQYQAASLWDDGGPCTIPGAPCIVTNQASNKFAMTGHLRMAYFNYLTSEKIAVAWTQDPITSPSILWKEFDNTFTQGFAPNVFAGVGNHYYYGPSTQYDCRGTLFLSFNAGNRDSPGDGHSLGLTFRYGTDTPDTMRTANFVSAGLTTRIPSGMISLSQILIPQARPIMTCHIQDDSTAYCIRFFQPDLTVTVRYTGTDACLNEASCTHSIFYSTRTPCNPALLN